MDLGRKLSKMIDDKVLLYMDCIGRRAEGESKGF